MGTGGNFDGSANARTEKAPVHMHSVAYEPLPCGGAYAEIGSLLLTKGEIEAGAQLEHIGLVSTEHIGDCAPANVAEKAQWPPNPLKFDTTAVTEREEVHTIPEHVIG